MVVRTENGPVLLHVHEYRKGDAALKITVIGCGRWGSLITWYLDSIGHTVTLYGRKTSKTMERFLQERKNDLLELPESIHLTTDIAAAKEAEVIVISVNSQGLQGLMDELKPLDLTDKIFVLCMKGIEIASGRRLSQVVNDNMDFSNEVAVWLGPGHVEEFYQGIPNCMVIDSNNQKVKELLVEEFSSDLIRFYYGQDLIGSEIGAAAKNVVGIAAGLLDGAGLSSLKGALMARGAREVARLIHAMGGNELSAYGLCHLGDYEATLFSPHSHNRMFGECFIKGQPYTQLAEGASTVKALIRLGQEYGVDLPICHVVDSVLYHNMQPDQALNSLFSRSVKGEFDL